MALPLALQSAALQRVDSAQIAAALGVKRRAVEQRAERGAWPYTAAPQRGGLKRWYALDDLPADVQQAFALAEARAAAGARLALARTAQAQATLPVPALPGAAGAVAKAVAGAAATATTATPVPAAQATASGTPGTAATTATAAVPAIAAVPAAGPIVLHGQIRRVAKREDLNDRDRAVLDAALQLCVAIDEARQATHCSIRLACTELAGRLHAGEAHAQLLAAARTTYQRPRLSPQDPHRVGLPEPLRQRLDRLYSFYLAGVKEGDCTRYLAPAAVKAGLDAMRKEDKLAFLAHYCRPSRPNVQQAWRDAGAWYEAHGFERPSADVFHRLEHLFPVAAKLRGRCTGSAWRAVMPHRSRDVSMFKSNDIWVGDGHTFKARVQSPITGKAFRPEVTLVIDWRSRKIVGWSIDLAESTLAVSAAFRDAQLRTRARPLVYYRDNGSGQTGKLIDCDLHGTLARQGIASETGIPGNPQGRGVIERLWQTVLIPFAATYPTFLGNQADPETVRKTQIQVLKDQRAGNVSALLPPWRTFLDDLTAHIDAYNARHRHSALGTTPDAAYAQHLDPDSICFAVGDDEIHNLWLPEVPRTPRRGLIELFGNKYYLPSLTETLPEGAQVRVRFDIHRAGRVLVLGMDGRSLGVAKWEGHRSAAFPVPYIEAKRAERVGRKVAKKLAEAKEAREELTLTFDAEPAGQMAAYAPAEPVPVPAAPVAANEEDDGEDPFQVYLAQKVAARAAADAQAQIDGRAEIEAGMQKAAEEAALRGEDDEYESF